MKKLKVNRFEQEQLKEKELGRRLYGREIARGAGIHESTLSTYRSGGIGMVRLSTLQKLANYFGCDAGDLLVTEEEK